MVIPQLLAAQGRADAIVGIVAFVMPQAKTHEDVKWKVLQKPIEVSYDAIGVGRGNYPLRDALNIALYDMHAVMSKALRTEFDYRDEPVVEIGEGPLKLSDAERS